MNKDCHDHNQTRTLKHDLQSEVDIALNHVEQG